MKTKCLLENDEVISLCLISPFTITSLFFLDNDLKEYVNLIIEWKVNNSITVLDPSSN
jgi:hypothetical protein